MAKFGNYKVEVKKDTTRECTMYGITTGEDKNGEPIYPILIVRPSWDVNTDYANARIKKSKGRSRSMKSKGITANDMRTIRREDIELYAEHVVTGWVSGTVLEEDGTAPEFNFDNCVDFLRAIPEPEFDELRAFTGSHENWGLDPLDTEDVAGN